MAAKQFKDALKAHREYRGLTQAKLAESTKISLSMIKALEAGTRHPSDYTTQKLIRAFHLESSEKAEFKRRAELVRAQDKRKKSNWRPAVDGVDGVDGSVEPTSGVAPDVDAPTLAPGDVSAAVVDDRAQARAEPPDTFPDAVSDGASLAQEPGPGEELEDAAASVTYADAPTLVDAPSSLADADGRYGLDERWMESRTAAPAYDLLRPPIAIRFEHALGWLAEHKKRLQLCVALVIVICVSFTADTVRPARAWPYASLIAAPALVVFCPGATAVCTMTVGAVQGFVHMLCWQDALWTDDHGHRWFYVQAPNGMEGFVHAGVIHLQPITPNCQSISWLDATEWALNQDGQTAIPPNAQNGYAASTWSSWSWLFADDAWKLGPGVPLAHTATSAQQIWNLYQASGATHTPSNMPPRGALVFFADGSHGQVTLSLGNGWVVGPQLTATAQAEPVTYMPIAQIPLPEVGYIPPNLI